MNLSYDCELDVCGLRCPMPLLKTKQALSSMSAAQIIKVTATDAGSWRDIPAFIELTSHILVSKQQVADQFVFHIKKGD